MHIIYINLLLNIPMAKLFKQRETYIYLVNFSHITGLGVGISGFNEYEYVLSTN